MDILAQVILDSFEDGVSEASVEKNKPWQGMYGRVQNFHCVHSVNKAKREVHRDVKAVQ